MDAVAIEQDLARIRRAISPRFAKVPVGWRSRAIHGGVLALWVLLFARAFGGGGLFAWSAGLAYVAYDTVLLGFVFWRTWALLRPATIAGGPLPAATVIVAAHNEAGVLPVTLRALVAQTVVPEIIVADDGSTDDTGSTLAAFPGVRWIRLPHGGKARALNVACARATTPLVLSVDADTVLDAGAIEAMVRAFAADPALVAATGVLTPVCGPGLSGRVLEWFQTYEYVRNFLSRYAWMREGGLLLISGAFACYRRDALLAVGGFDPDCLVEDYELTHRMRDHAVRNGVVWRTAVVGGAHAQTDAPGSVGTFLRQRRRWFGGFLQTQLWYRHMVGEPRYGRLGTRMLPVKAVDTLQPLYGLTGVLLLLVFLAGGAPGVFGPVAWVVGGKIALDLGFYLWSLVLYRRWVGSSAGLRLWPAVAAALLEPFTFQVLRHAGAALGWIAFATGGREWGARDRRAMAVAAP